MEKVSSQPQSTIIDSTQSLHLNKKIYITGLTAIGKTKLSIQLAKHFPNTEIINSDSQQFYKDADIMTATASMEERENIPHHLLSFLDTTETEFNCNKFVSEALQVLKDMQERKVGHVIIVGGTNYYTESMIFSKNRKQHHGGDLGKREAKESDSQMKLTQEQKSELEELLVDKDFDKMHEFYKKIEPEKATLVIKNDVRKLENILKRLLAFKSTEYTWDMGSAKNDQEKFLVFALDTSNTKWLESRIRKRIAEMVCDEGGLEETFALLWKMVQHFHKSETTDGKHNKKKIVEIAENLQGKTSHGVLQAIGYKEFIPLFHESLSKIVADLGDNLDAEQMITIGEKLKEEAKSLTKQYNTHKLLTQNIQNLANDTIKLTKKQRKWIKNRIYTNRNLLKNTFTFDVQSKKQFFEDILPKAKDIAEQFLQSDCVNSDLKMKELKAKYPQLDRELKAKNKKTVLNCEVCNRTIVGEIEGKRHMRSNHHKFKVRQLKKKVKDLKI